MPHASLPSRINSSPSFHHRPSTLSPFHPSPHARPVHFCSLDKTPRNAGEKSRLRPLFLDEGALTAPAASPFLPPRGFDGELSGLDAEAAANGAKADTTGGGKGPRRWTLTMRKERGSIERGFPFERVPFLGTNDRNSSHDIIFYSLCYLFFHGLIGLKIFSRIIIELIKGILISDGFLICHVVWNFSLLPSSPTLKVKRSPSSSTNMYIIYIDGSFSNISGIE